MTTAKWEDQKEREYRQMWINMRLEGQGRVEWDDAAEREAREMERKRSEARKKKPIVWDDEEERNCQERYRNKWK